MPTNIQESMGTWLVGIAQVNLGSIGGWKPAMPTLQNATKCERAPRDQRSIA
ncbi:hypothetical protein LYNGBM3L_05370 [Moorena producens 3L]|uniref:Uncharacterized protein n=1 Tax=Moorena producens 3L TaxID=489825 RepID=F4XRW2_9CYAN|nr:hypothetical protein LYNGBM3L_05370 [Moorena producens 3L]